MSRVLPVGFALSLSAVTSLSAQNAPARLTQFLTDRIGLSQSELTAVERGEPVVKVLNTENNRDIAVFGIVAVDVPRAWYVDRLQDFQNSLRRPTQMQFGHFSAPAALQDVAALTFDGAELATVRTCKAGQCPFKMHASDMQRMRESIDWSAPDAGDQANAYVRRRLVDYVNSYRAHGDSAMVVYDDRATVRGSAAFGALLQQSPYVYQEDPALYQYLAQYPRDTLANVRDVLYWTVDTIAGLKPILTVNQLVVHATAGDSLALIAMKQIYADHYFEAGLNLVAVVARPAAATRAGIYLIRLDRSRFDNIPSVPLVNVRGKVTKRFREQMRGDLEREKGLAEAAARAR